VDPDCEQIFIDCNKNQQSPPFIYTTDVGQSRFGIMAMKLKVGYCEIFCAGYGGFGAVVDTDEKYKTVYKMIQIADKKLSGSGVYVIGLSQGK
jgi:hypothetical protein